MNEDARTVDSASGQITGSTGSQRVASTAATTTQTKLRTVRRKTSDSGHVIWFWSRDRLDYHRPTASVNWIMGLTLESFNNPPD